jgi:hypothetical protein
LTTFLVAGFLLAAFVAIVFFTALRATGLLAGEDLAAFRGAAGLPVAFLVAFFAIFLAEATFLVAPFLAGAVFLAGLRVLRVAIVHNLRSAFHESMHVNHFTCINR